MDDRELLGEFLAHHSEKAFTGLVERHVNLVYATALRVVGNRAAAQDVAQAVFILLARRAWMVRDGNALAGWLYRAAYRTAVDAVRSEQRRRAREAEAMNRINDTMSSQTALEKISPWLDEALQALSPAEQNAVMLRYFEGKSLGEVGRALAVSEQAAHKRVTRAVEKMRAHFVRRGLAVGAGVVAEVMNAQAAQLAPAGLAAQMAANSLAAGSAGTGGILLKLFYMTTKTKTILAAAILLLAAAISFTATLPGNTSNPDASAKTTDTAASQKSGEVKGELLPVTITHVQTPAQAPVAATANPPAKETTNPRLPMPGVYPNRPKLDDVMAAARANPGNPSIMQEGMIRSRYGNLFQKMRFTPEQIDVFVKIQLDKDAQEAAMLRQNPIDAKTSTSLATLEPAKASALLEQHYDPLEKAIEQNVAPQIQQLMGSDDNYQYYEDYTDQNIERSPITMGYASALEAAGVPALTVDQEEQLTGLVYQYRKTANGPLAPEQAGQMLKDAGKFISPAQVEVLLQIMPSLAAPRTKWQRGT